MMFSAVLITAKQRRRCGMSLPLRVQLSFLGLLHHFKLDRCLRKARGLMWRRLIGKRICAGMAQGQNVRVIRRGIPIPDIADFLIAPFFRAITIPPTDPSSVLFSQPDLCCHAAVCDGFSPRSVICQPFALLQYHGS